MTALDAAYHVVVLLLCAVFAIGAAQAVADPENPAPLAWRLFWPALFTGLAAWSAARLLR